MNFSDNKSIKRVMFCEHCGADNIVSFGISIQIAKTISSSSGAVICWYCKKLFNWRVDWKNMNFLDEVL